MSNDCITYLGDILEKLGRVLALLEGVTPPEPPFPPQADIITVVVKPPGIKKQIPLREIKKLNKAGYPVWRIYLDQNGKRVRPKRGDELRVYEKIVRGDGGNLAYRLTPAQIINGHIVPTPSTLYVLVMHTE